MASRRPFSCAFFWLLLRPWCFVADGAARPRRTDDDVVLRRAETLSGRDALVPVVDVRPDADPVPPATLWRARATAVEEEDREVEVKAGAAGRDPRRGSAWVLDANWPRELRPVACCCCCCCCCCCFFLSDSASREGGGFIMSCAQLKRFPSPEPPPARPG